ncbi:MAG: helix-turn-helix domain-containing protein [archaeon]
MDVTILERIGLSKAEIKVYLTLFELGSVSSGPIVQETGMRKSTVYESIRRLSEKGLVSYVIKQGKKHFDAQDPEKIVDFIHQQKRQLDEVERDAHTFIQEIKQGFGVLKPKAEAHVLEGIEGFKTMRRDVLRHAKGELLLIGAIAREIEVMPGFFEDWNRQRQKRGIVQRILHKESVRSRYKEQRSYIYSVLETRFLPEEIENPAVINIYGDRVVNVLWKKSMPICFLLINKEIADSYRKYFQYLWKISTN